MLKGQKLMKLCLAHKTSAAKKRSFEVKSSLSYVQHCNSNLKFKICFSNRTATSESVFTKNLILQNQQSQIGKLSAKVYIFLLQKVFQFAIADFVNG